VLVAVEFHGDAGVGAVVAKQIDFHLPEAVEGDGQHGIEPESVRASAAVEFLVDLEALRSLKRSQIPA
jgi:hypothetical protein